MHEILYDQRTKLLKFTYKPIFVSFRNIDIPSDDISRSRKGGTFLSKTPTINLKLQ